MDMLTLCTYSVTVCSNVIITLSSNMLSNKGNNKITELRTILQRQTLLRPQRNQYLEL
jgi:hypothetical protein